MADRPPTRPESSRKRSWIGKYGKERDGSGASLPTPQEGQELSYHHPLNSSSPNLNSASSLGPASSTHTPVGGGLPFRRSNSATSLDSSVFNLSPAAPPHKSSSSSSLLTREELDQQASQIILNALERTNSRQKAGENSHRSSTSFSKKSLASLMPGLSSLSLSRSRGEVEERGRPSTKERDKKSRSSSFSGTQDENAETAAQMRARSQSPFHLRRIRTRDTSPTVGALTQSDVESDVEVNRIRPRNAFSQDDDDSQEGSDDDDDSDEESWSEGDGFDPLTTQNTERNALVPADLAEADTTEVPDPLGEGVNVVIPPEPYFPSTLNAGVRNPRRRKSTRPQDMLPLVTSRPVFQRDRCTITLTHGDPEKALEGSGRRAKRYVLASDLSDESRYALEWGIGTVLRDGDELLIVTVMENEDKVDPLIPNPTDRMTKLRSQQERQGFAYILVRQATSLLQRTRLHVTVACQAWHAKNSRHMLLDIIDYVEPSMLIVGSRGLGKLKGILLGSTSHYLIQKCSVPVMVARRRLKRPPRRSAHLAPHRARVSLAEAGIDRVATKVDQDVAVMREQAERDERDSQDNHAPDPTEIDDDDADTEVEGPSIGKKVAG